MCEYCEGGKPIHKCDEEGVDVRLIHNRDGLWALDFRHVFYRRCNKCGARSKPVKTDWHVRTEDEAEDFSIYGSQKDKQWGFDPESEWARPWREAADEAWNRRA